MRVSVDNNGLERRVSVEVPEDRIATEVQSRLQQMSKSARIDGFRPGKAPLRVVQRRYGAAVRDEVVGEVLRSTFVEAMDKEKLRPAGEPMIDPVQDKPGEGLSYTATFEVFPEVAVSPVAELNIERIRCDIGDADIDKMIETIRGQNQAFEDAAAPAENGNKLTIDFIGTMDGEAFEGGSAEGVELELGSGRMIPGFEEGLVGATAGESRRLELAFPENYHAEGLAGKPVAFDITVQSVKVPVLPELDAEFFARFGVEDGELATFRQSVRAQMERERDREVADRFRSETLKQLGEANPIDVPQSLVSRDAALMAQQMRQNMMMQGMPSDQAETITPEAFTEDATRRVRLGLVLSEIVKREQIAVEAEAVRAEVERQAANYQDAESVVKWYYEDPERLQEIEMRCLEQKVVDWVAGQATVSEVELEFDALMNPGQTAPDAKDEV